MRVLFLNPIAEIGGAERVLLTAVRGLRRADPDGAVHLLIAGHGPLADRARELGASVDSVPMPAKLARWGDSPSTTGGRARRFARLAGAVQAVVPFAWTLRRRIIAWSPDVVHSNGVKTHLLAAATLPRSIPVVWHAHDFYGARPTVRRLVRLVRLRAARAVAISGAIARDLHEHFPGLPVAVLGNRIDVDRFRPEGNVADLDGASGLPQAEASVVRIGLVATYARWKGHLVFLDAARRIRSERPDISVRFYLVGGPIYQTSAQFSVAELRREIDARGLADCVGISGFHADTASVYRALDVVVHASTAPEPFGLTIVEAMACGRAVVAAAAGGAAELFEPDVEAVSVAPGDPRALAEALLRPATDPTFRRRLGENARRTAVRNFDEKSYGDDLLAVYQGLQITAR